MPRWTRFAALFAVLLLLLAGAVVAQEATPEATPAAAETTADTPADAAPASGAMLTGLRHLHSFVRWLIVLVTIAVIVKLVLGLVQNAPYDSLTGRLMRIFSILISVQWLIGLVYFIVLATQIGGFGNLQPYNWLHLVVMTVAAGIAEMHRRFKDAPDRNRYRGNLVIVVMVLALVVIGVALLPYGWRILPPA